MTNKRFKTFGEFARFKAEVYAKYQPFGATATRMDEAFETIQENLDGFEHGAITDERFLFVIGETGTGKSYTLRHYLRQMDSLQPYVNKYGETVNPLISFKADRVLTPRELLNFLLDKIDLPSQASETEAKKVLRDQIPARGIKCIHIDEMQHAIRSNTPKTILGMQDAVKSLLEIADWPLHMIFSGVSSLDNLRKGDGQITRRSIVVPFRQLKVEDDEKFISKGFKTVVVDHCGLALDKTVQGSDFFGRLCKASNGGWGYMIETTQKACFLAIKNGNPAVTSNHFAHNYRLKFGPKKDENIFTAKHWSKLKVPEALADMHMED